MIQCPKCGKRNDLTEHNILKQGFRKTKNRGKLQKHQCRNCGYRFTVSKVKRMRYRRKIINYTLKNVKLSSREIKDKIYKKFKINISHTTICRWISKYYKPIKVKMEMDFSKDKCYNCRKIFKISKLKLYDISDIFDIGAIPDKNQFLCKSCKIDLTKKGYKIRKPNKEGVFVFK